MFIMHKIIYQYIIPFKDPIRSAYCDNTALIKLGNKRGQVSSGVSKKAKFGMETIPLWRTDINTAYKRTVYPSLSELI